MINTLKDRDNLYVNLGKLDLITKLKPLLDRKGYILRIEDGKFVPRFTSVAYDAPWVYVKTDPMARCDIYQTVFFQELGQVHSYCRSCWKVVVRPKTLEQLFDLYELEKSMGVPCKCGIELRETVHGLYGGYFYTRSKQQGLGRYKEVRQLVDDRLGKDVAVILKRYCTEYEIGPGSLGPSDQLPDLTDEEKEYEAFVESHFPRVGFGTVQPDHITARVMVKWIHYAYQNGDETYKKFTGGNPLFHDYVTYHREGKENGND